MILRIDHSFEVGEDPVLSQPVQINLDALFTHVDLQSCTEMTLTANQPLADVNRYVWKTEEQRTRGEFERSQEEIKRDKNAFVVTISPMEIRTWSCTYTRV